MNEWSNRRRQRGARSVATARKQPMQRRARQRVERLLNVARDLIRERGYAGLNIRELAETADVNIATVYQYYPNAKAILRALAERDLEKMQISFAAEIERLSEFGDLGEIAEALIDFVFEFYRCEPAHANIARGMQSDTDLLELDLEDTFRSSRQFQEVILKRQPRAQKNRTRGASLMLTTLVPAVVRIAMAVDTRTRASVRRELKAMVSSYLAAFQHDIASVETEV